MTSNHHLYEQHIPTRSFARRVEWEAYAVWLRRQARVSLALLPEPPRCPLNARVFGGWEENGVRCEKVYFESLPGLYVTGNLFRPVRAKHPLAVILSPHGHLLDSRLQDYHPDICLPARGFFLAKMGAAVLVYDMVGYADNCQLPHSVAPDTAWGLSLMALQTWNSIRALDFLLDLPGVDARRVGVTGESGGGTQTFTLASVDERVTAAAPINMIAADFHGGCLCENAPLLRVAANNLELARLCAPKPLFLGSCTQDWTRLTPEREMPAMRAVYNLYRAGGKLSGVHVDAPHNYNRQTREAAYAFFARHLFHGMTPPTEEGLPYFPLRERVVWWGQTAPVPMAPATLRALWRDSRQTALAPYRDNPDAARATLGPLLAHTVVLTEESLAAYRQREPLRISSRRQGETLVIHPLSTPRDPAATDRDYLTYHRAPAAEAVMEILAALANTGTTRLRGVGKAGPWCLLAAALCPAVRRVEANLAGFDFDDDAAWQRCLDIPSIRQLGGMTTILAMLAERVVKLRS